LAAPSDFFTISGWDLKRGCSGWKTTCAPWLSEETPWLGQLGVHLLDLVPVEALAVRLVEADPQLVVDALEGREAHLVDPPPEREAPRVARLELHELGPGRLHDGRVGFGGGIAHLVEALELLDRVAGERGLVRVSPEGPDQLAELGSPVADVVVAHDPRAGEGRRASRSPRR
jgi:hypothetical protein